MLYFILIVVALLVTLRIIIKPAKVTAKTAKTTANPVKAANLTRHDNAIMRSIDRTGW